MAGAAARAVVEEVGCARSAAETTVLPRWAAVSRKTNSRRSRDWNCHLGPFRRRPSPARPMHWPEWPLPSPTDASLSAQRTCWRGARGSAPASSIAGAGSAARSGRRRRLALPTRGAARPHTSGRSAGLDHIERTGEDEHDIGRKRRPENSPTAPAPKPPITGHGAQAVVKVQQLRSTGAPESSRVVAPGLSLILAGALPTRNRP